MYLYAETGNGYSTLSKENRILTIKTNVAQIIKCVDINRSTFIYAEPNETIEFDINKKGLIEYHCKTSPIRNLESKFINDSFEKYGATEADYIRRIKQRVKSSEKLIHLDASYKNEKALSDDYFSKGNISKEYHRYFNSLLWTLTTDNKIHNPSMQKDGLTELKKSFSNPEYLLNISEYRRCLQSYLYFEMKSSNIKDNLYSSLQFIPAHFSSQAIIDYLSYSKIKSVLLQSKQKIDNRSLNLFYTVCKNNQFISEVKTDINQHTNTVFLKKIIEKSGCKFALIDFWASWCKPCLEEIPYTISRIKEYPEVKYIFISIDKSKFDWINETKKRADIFNASNSFLFSEIKDEDLLDKLKITTIPRFVLLNSKGDIINLDFSRPSDPNFKISMDKALNK